LFCRPPAKHCMSTSLGFSRQRLVKPLLLASPPAGRHFPFDSIRTRLQLGCIRSAAVVRAPSRCKRWGAASRGVPLRLPLQAAAYSSRIGSSDASHHDGPGKPKRPSVVLEHEEVPLPPSQLPPPPAAEGLLHVLLYSFRICLTERWAVPRLAAVFGLLFVSRMAGKQLHGRYGWLRMAMFAVSWACRGDRELCVTASRLAFMKQSDG